MKAMSAKLLPGDLCQAELPAELQPTTGLPMTPGRMNSSQTAKPFTLQLVPRWDCVWGEGPALAARGMETRSRAALPSLSDPRFPLCARFLWLPQ